jgi:hypothetical protein
MHVRKVSHSILYKNFYHEKNLRYEDYLEDKSKIYIVEPPYDVPQFKIHSISMTPNQQSWCEISLV